MQHTVIKNRIRASRKEHPTYAIIDSQSVKTVGPLEESRL